MKSLRARIVRPVIQPVMIPVTRIKNGEIVITPNKSTLRQTRRDGNPRGHLPGNLVRGVTPSSVLTVTNKEVINE